MRSFQSRESKVSAVIDYMAGTQIKYLLTPQNVLVSRHGANHFHITLESWVGGLGGIMGGVDSQFSSRDGEFDTLAARLALIVDLVHLYRQSQLCIALQRHTVASAIPFMQLQ